MSGNPTKGYLYVVCGSQPYYDEACWSIKSLLDIHPGARIACVCDRPTGFPKPIRDLLEPLIERPMAKAGEASHGSSREHAGNTRCLPYEPPPHPLPSMPTVPVSSIAIPTCVASISTVCSMRWSTKIYQPSRRPVRPCAHGNWCAQRILPAQFRRDPPVPQYTSCRAHQINHPKINSF